MLIHKIQYMKKLFLILLAFLSFTVQAQFVVFTIAGGPSTQGAAAAPDTAQSFIVSAHDLDTANVNIIGMDDPDSVIVNYATGLTPPATRFAGTIAIQTADTLDVKNAKIKIDVPDDNTNYAFSGWYKANGSWQTDLQNDSTQLDSIFDNIIAVYNFSTDQDFVIVDDASNGEYVGLVKPFPIYKDTNMTYTEITNSTFSLSDSIITIQDSTELVVGTTMAYQIIVSNPGSNVDTLTANILVLAADSCTYIDLDAVSDGAGTRADPNNTTPALTDYSIYLYKRGSDAVQGLANNGTGNMTFASYGTGDYPILLNNGGRIMNMGGGSNVMIRDIEFNSPTPTDTSSWHVAIHYKHNITENFDSIHIEKCHFYHTQQAVVVQTYTIPVYNSNSWIDWNDIYNTRIDAIFTEKIDGRNTIRYNHITGINMDWFYVAPNENDAPGDGIQSDQQEDLEISWNFIDRSETGAKFCLIVGGHSDPCDITDNYMISPGMDAGGYCTHLQFYHKYYVRNTHVAANSGTGIGYWGYSGADDTVAYNVNINLAIGMRIEGATGVSVFNNVFDSCDLGIQTYGPVYTAYNNIFSGITTGNQPYLDNAGANTWDYNLFSAEVTNMFGVGVSTLAAWQSATGEDANSLVGDPEFVADKNYRLQSTSPAIDTGIYLGFDVDYYGSLVGGNPDIGVSENTAAPTYAPDSAQSYVVSSPNKDSVNQAVIGFDPLATHFVVAWDYVGSGSPTDSTEGTKAFSFPVADTALYKDTTFAVTIDRDTNLYFAMLPYASGGVGDVNKDSVAVDTLGASATVYTDDFEAYSAGYLSAAANWEDVLTADSAAVIDVSGDKVVTGITSAANALTRYTGGTFDGDQYAEITVDVASWGSYVGVAVRCQGTGGTADGYYFTNRDYRLEKIVDGSITNLYTGTGSIGSNDDVLRIEISGSTITCYVNDVQECQETDTDITGGNPGVYTYSYHGSNASTIDDFECSDF